MILPHTNFSILVLMVVSLFCLGSWANTFKLAGKWRYELYYFDFAFGLILLTLVYVLTLGNMGYDGFGVMDSVMNAGKQQWLFAFGAGVVFTLGNTLLIAVVSTAGMTLAFPVAMGAAIILGAIINWASGPVSMPLFLWTGCLLVAAAMAADALGHIALLRLRHEALARAGKAKSTRRPFDLKDTVMAVVAGLLLGSLPLLLQRATVADIGLGPYAVWLFFGVGALATTMAGGMFLLNLSMQEEELSITAFIKSSPRQHIWGMMGGALWLTGALAAFVAIYANTAPGVNGGLAAGATPVGSAPIYALSQCAALLAAIWGIVAWKEGRGGNSSVRLMTGLTLVLFAGGVGLITLSGVGR
jgi:glucose uptake protein